MKTATYWALLPTLLSASLVHGVFPISQVKKGNNNLPTVPNKFIIEVDSLANIPTKRSFERVRSSFYLRDRL
jgi:hypothetical protein